MKSIVILLALVLLFSIFLFSLRARERGRKFWQFTLKVSGLGYEKLKAKVKAVSISIHIVDIISADILTYARVILALWLWYYILWGNWREHLLKILGIDIIAYLTDLFDGSIAELKGTKSAWGSKIDNTADKILAIPNLYFLIKLQNSWDLAIWIASIEIILVGFRIYGWCRKVNLEANRLGKAKLLFQGIGFCCVVSNWPYVPYLGKLILIASVFLAGGSLFTHIAQNYSLLFKKQPGS